MCRSPCKVIGFTFAAVMSLENSRGPRLFTLSGWPRVPYFRPPSSHSREHESVIVVLLPMSELECCLMPLVSFHELDRLRR